MKNSQPVIVRAFVAAAAVAAVAVPGAAALAEAGRAGAVDATVVADGPVAEAGPTVTSPEPGFGWG